ncbi:MAG: MarR family transcriptional regulator [Gammaproteobacteria bacterium]|nr:MarR family transcriptional regulator [Gammaproteobacteria bacterium]
MQHEDLDRNFGFLLHDVSRLLRTAYDRKVRALGLTRSQWWVLTHLYRNAGTTQSELAALLEIEKASLGRMLDRLEANGWVRRESDATDRRVRRVFLTETFGPSMRQLRSAAADLRAEALIGIDPADMERFIDVLQCMKTNLICLNADDGGAQGPDGRGVDAGLEGRPGDKLDDQPGDQPGDQATQESSRGTASDPSPVLNHVESNEHTVV